LFRPDLLDLGENNSDPFPGTKRQTRRSLAANRRSVVDRSQSALPNREE
jgi:hypothetical protein